MAWLKEVEAAGVATVAFPILRRLLVALLALIARTSGQHIINDYINHHFKHGSNSDTPYY